MARKYYLYLKSTERPSRKTYYNCANQTKQHYSLLNAAVRMHATLMYTDCWHTFPLCRQRYSDIRKKLRYLHDCVHNLSSDCHPALKNAGKRTTDFTYDNACSPAQSDEGKALCKDCCKPIIVTVCNNTEVIHQLLSVVHSSTLVEERVNCRIHRFSFFPACITYFVTPLLHRCLFPELCAFCPPPT